MSSWPYFAQDEIDAVVAVLRSGKVNQWTGEQVRLFEKEFAAYHECQYGVAVANGTVALELALETLDIGPGDDVVTTSRTFLASASSIVMRGARPVFADVDRDSQNITVETIKAAMTPRTKAIVAVHLAGWPCDMDEIMTFAKENNLLVIEDCAQAHGAKYKGKLVGSWGHMAAFSFCQDKIMTTGGEGGMVTTNDEALFKKAWSFKDHGKDYDVVFNKQHPPGFRWLHERFGTNWRMTEMQAAIGREQLKKLPSWLVTRKRFAEMLRNSLDGVLGVRVVVPPANVEHANYKYYLFVEPAELNDAWDRDRVIQKINAQGVFCQVGSCSEIYRENCFSQFNFVQENRMPVAKELGETSLMCLIHPTLTEEDILHTSKIIKSVILQAIQIPAAI